MSDNNLVPGQTLWGSQRTVTAFACTVFFTVFAPVVVALRFYAKRLRGTILWWDDWLILAALICYLGNLAGVYAIIFIGGLGHHRSDVTPTGQVVLAKQNVIIRWVYILEMFLIRYSICLFIWKIFPIRRVHIGVIVAMTVNVAWFIFGFFYIGFLCQPFAYNWDRTLAGGKCLDPNVWFAAVFAWEILIDFLIWSVPIRSVWMLQMPKTQKLFVVAIFGFGLLGIAIAIIRIIVVVNVNFEDESYSAVNGLIWSLAEPAVGILVACAPFFKVIVDKTINPAWRKAFRKMVGSHASTLSEAEYFDNEANDTLDLVPQGYGTEMKGFVDGEATSENHQAASGAGEAHNDIVVRKDLNVTRVS